MIWGGLLRLALVAFVVLLEACQGLSLHKIYNQDSRNNNIYSANNLYQNVPMAFDVSQSSDNPVHRWDDFYNNLMKLNEQDAEIKRRSFENDKYNGRVENNMNNKRTIQEIEDESVSLKKLFNDIVKLHQFGLTNEKFIKTNLSDNNNRAHLDDTDKLFKKSIDNESVRFKSSTDNSINLAINKRDMYHDIAYNMSNGTYDLGMFRSDHEADDSVTSRYGKVEQQDDSLNNGFNKANETKISNVANDILSKCLVSNTYLKNILSNYGISNTAYDHVTVPTTIGNNDYTEFNNLRSAVNLQAMNYMNLVSPKHHSTAHFMKDESDNQLVLSTDKKIGFSNETNQILSMDSSYKALHKKASKNYNKGLNMQNGNLMVFKNRIMNPTLSYYVPISAWFTLPSTSELSQSMLHSTTNSYFLNSSATESILHMTRALSEVELYNRDKSETASNNANSALKSESQSDQSNLNKNYINLNHENGNSTMNPVDVSLKPFQNADMMDPTDSKVYGNLFNIPLGNYKVNDGHQLVPCNSNWVSAISNEKENFVNDKFSSMQYDGITMNELPFTVILNKTYFPDPFENATAFIDKEKKVLTIQTSFPDFGPPHLPGHNNMSNIIHLGVAKSASANVYATLTSIITVTPPTDFERTTTPKFIIADRNNILFGSFPSTEPTDMNNIIYRLIERIAAEDAVKKLNFDKDFSKVRKFASENMFNVRDHITQNRIFTPEPNVFTKSISDNSQELLSRTSYEISIEQPVKSLEEDRFDRRGYHQPSEGDRHGSTVKLSASNKFKTIGKLPTRINIDNGENSSVYITHNDDINTHNEHKIATYNITVHNDYELINGYAIHKKNHTLKLAKSHTLAGAEIMKNLSNLNGVSTTQLSSPLISESPYSFYQDYSTTCAISKENEQEELRQYYSTEQAAFGDKSNHFSVLYPLFTPATNYLVPNTSSANSVSPVVNSNVNNVLTVATKDFYFHAKFKSDWISSTIIYYLNGDIVEDPSNNGLSQERNDSGNYRQINNLVKLYKNNAQPLKNDGNLNKTMYFDIANQLLQDLLHGEKNTSHPTEKNTITSIINLLNKNDLSNNFTRDTVIDERNYSDVNIKNAKRVMTTPYFSPGVASTNSDFFSSGLLPKMSLVVTQIPPSGNNDKVSHTKHNDYNDFTVRNQLIGDESLTTLKSILSTEFSQQAKVYHTENDPLNMLPKNYSIATDVTPVDKLTIYEANKNFDLNKPSTHTPSSGFLKSTGEKISYYKTLSSSKLNGRIGSNKIDYKDTYKSTEKKGYLNQLPQDKLGRNYLKYLSLSTEPYSSFSGLANNNMEQQHKYTGYITNRYNKNLPGDSEVYNVYRMLNYLLSTELVTRNISVPTMANPTTVNVSNRLFSNDNNYDNGSEFVQNSKNYKSDSPLLLDNNRISDKGFNNFSTSMNFVDGTAFPAGLDNVVLALLNKISSANISRFNNSTKSKKRVSMQNATAADGDDDDYYYDDAHISRVRPMTINDSYSSAHQNQSISLSDKVSNSVNYTGAKNIFSDDTKYRPKIFQHPKFVTAEKSKYAAQIKIKNVGGRTVHPTGHQKRIKVPSLFPYAASQQHNLSYKTNHNITNKLNSIKV